MDAEVVGDGDGEPDGVAEAVLDADELADDVGTEDWVGKGVEVALGEPGGGDVVLQLALDRGDELRALPLDPELPGKDELVPAATPPGPLLLPGPPPGPPPTPR